MAIPMAALQTTDAPMKHPVEIPFEDVATGRISALPAPDVARIPPHSDEAEKGAIASIMVEARRNPNEPPCSILEAQAKISSAHFFIPANRKIWEVLCRMFEQKKKLDFITVTQELRDLNYLDSVGGPGYITDLGDFVPSSSNIESYLEILRDKFALRQIIALGAESVRRAYEKQEDVPGLLDEMQESFTKIAMNKLADSPVRHIKDDVMAVIEEFENAKKHRGRTQGLATGYQQLDRMTSGMMGGDMIVLAARPSMGKTAFAMNIGEWVACPRHCEHIPAGNKPKKCPTCNKWTYPGAPVVVFSLETSRRKLVRRMLCGKSHVSLQRLRDGMLEEKHISQIIKGSGELTPAPIYIDETSALRVFDFKARARYAATTLGAKLLIIDYVQLMTTGGKASVSPYERSIELTRISAAIKEVARDLNIAVIAIAQLNREAEKTHSSKPRMSHLRECGAFEQDADHVWLLWRAEYYESDEKQKQLLEGDAELIIAKQKDGPTGEVRLTFLKEYTRFDGQTDAPLYSPNRENWQEGYREDEQCQTEVG